MKPNKKKDELRTLVKRVSAVILIIIGISLIALIMILLNKDSLNEYLHVEKLEHGRHLGEIVPIRSVGEGEQFAPLNDDIHYFTVKYACRPGLDATPLFGKLGDSCRFSFRGVVYVCIKCGDGICGPGENSCLCPQDCKLGEGQLTL